MVLGKLCSWAMYITDLALDCRAAIDVFVHCYTYSYALQITTDCHVDAFLVSLGSTPENSELAYGLL
jgi:hypothetical protein